MENAVRVRVALVEDIGSVRREKCESRKMQVLDKMGGRAETLRRRRGALEKKGAL